MEGGAPIIVETEPGKLPGNVFQSLLRADGVSQADSNTPCRRVGDTTATIIGKKVGLARWGGDLCGEGIVFDNHLAIAAAHFSLFKKYRLLGGISRYNDFAVFTPGKEKKQEKREDDLQSLMDRRLACSQFNHSNPAASL